MATDRKNSGTLSPNKRKEKDSHPDFKGQATIGGKDYWISAWKKRGEYGEFLSLSFEEKDPTKVVKPAPDAPEGKEPF